MICGISGIADKPGVLLICNHIFHVECIVKILKNRWLSPRIVFGFPYCTICKTKISAPYCPEIYKEMVKINSFEIETFDLADLKWC